MKYNIYDKLIIYFLEQEILLQVFKGKERTLFILIYKFVLDLY